MAFDPDEYLRSKGVSVGTQAPPASPPAGFDPDEYLRQKVGPLTDEKKRELGLPVLGASPVGSFLRQAGQAALMGFSDELAGVGSAAAALFTPGESVVDEYRKGRDEERAAIANDPRVNPTASTAGTVAGIGAGLLMPGGAAAKGAGTLAKMAAGAKTGLALGTAAGVGASDADLTKGDVVGTLKDAVWGAATGGLVGGAIPVAVAGGKKAWEGAKKVGGAIKGGSTQNARRTAVDKVVEAQREGGEDAFRAAAVEEAPVLAAKPGGRANVKTSDQAVDVAKDAVAEEAYFQLMHTAGNRVKKKNIGVAGKNRDAVLSTFKDDLPLAEATIEGDAGAKRAWDLVLERQATHGRALDDAYSRVSAKGEVDVPDVVGSLEKLWYKYAKNAQTQRQAKTVENQIKTLQEIHGAHGKLSLQDARANYRKAQDRAFEGSGDLSESEAKALQKELSGIFKGHLDKRIGEIGRANPELAGELEKIRELRRIESNYYRVGDILKEKATNVASASQTMGMAVAQGVRPGDWQTYARQAARGSTIGTLKEKGFEAGADAASAVNYRVNKWAQKRAQGKAQKAWDEAAAETDAITPGSPPIAGEPPPSSWPTATVLGSDPEKQKTFFRVLNEQVSKGVPRQAAIQAAMGAAGIKFD